MSVLHIALLRGCDGVDIAFLPGCDVAQLDNGRLGVAPLQGDVGHDGVLEGDYFLQRFESQIELRCNQRSSLRLH